MVSYLSEVQAQGGAAQTAAVPEDRSVFEYKQPERLARAEQCLLDAVRLNEHGSPIRAVRSLIEAVRELQGFVERREYLRQRRVYERSNEPASGKSLKVIGRADRDTLKTMLFDGACDNWISELTGVKRSVLRVMREALGLSHERRGGSYTQRREQRKAFEAKWRPALVGKRTGP